MPINKFILPRNERTKREELKTYRELDLRRDLKSIAQRRRVEANGLRRVIGDGSGSQPYLIVEAKRYQAMRLEVQKQFLIEARRIGAQSELRIERNKIDRVRFEYRTDPPGCRRLDAGIGVLDVAAAPGAGCVRC